MHRRRKSRRRLAYGSGGARAADSSDNVDLARAIVDWCAHFELCERDACFRARGCRGPAVACFEAYAEHCFEMIGETPVGQRLFDFAVRHRNPFAPR